MKKKIWIPLAAVAVIVLLSGIWLLDLPNWKHLDRNLLEQLQNASVVFDRDGNEAFSLYGTQRRRSVLIDQLPEHVPLAFVAAEDQRFFRHKGIDVWRIMGAALSNLRQGALAEGASTITQQLIKLTHLSSEKTFRRKIQEARLAMEAERIYSKDEILQMYLNAIYFGSGAYGIEAAANTYFAKTAAELTVSEAALLAGIIKSPNNYSPSKNMQKALQRRDYVLSQMKNCGYIDDVTFRIARNETIRLSQTADTGITGWYRDAVISEAAQVMGISADELLIGGYRIETALDMDMQRRMDACMADAGGFPEGGVQGAMIAVEPANGGILAVSGGRNDDVRMALNRALNSRRQPGSLIKPISVYAAAIDSRSMVPSDFADDTQRVFADGYMPRNAGDNYYGMVTLRTALSRSLNVATVSLAEQIGVPAIRNYARRFGIPVENDEASLSFALGSMTYGVTPAEIAGAYASLANGGIAVQPHLITRITDARGQEVYRHQSKYERIVSANTAYMLTDMLMTAAQTGSAHALSGAEIPVAGKTGTVSESGGTRDIWTAAYTPEVSLCVWMGYDTSAQGTMPDSASGSGYPAKLAAQWLMAVRDQLQGSQFTMPEGLVRISLDRVSLEEAHQALLPGEDTPQNEICTEIFPKNAVPTKVSGRYARPSGALGASLGRSALGNPVIRFRAAEDGMEYVIVRHQDGEISCIATLAGAAGEMMEYVDAEASLLEDAEYQIIIRRKDRYGSGALITQTADGLLHFEPAAAKLIGGDEMPPEQDVHQEQSLFAQ